MTEGLKLTIDRRDFDAEGLVVFSLGRHWSTGVFAAARSSTRQNQDMTLEIAPAIEYNLYPYEESTRRQILFTYTVGPVYYDYEEETLYHQFSETLVQQRLDISAGFQQPWGEIDASLEGSSYLHDPELHRIDLFSRVEVRLFREDEIPWDRIAFRTIARTLRRFFLDRRDGAFPLRVSTLERRARLEPDLMGAA